MVGTVAKRLAPVALLAAVVASNGGRHPNAPFPAGAPSAAPTRAEPIAMTTLRYGTEPSRPRQALDLYRPAGEAKTPLLIFLHGGAWISGSKDRFGHVGRAFAARGIATALVEYRLSAPGNGVAHPDHVKDAALAVDWLFAEAPRLGVDPTRVFVMGHSAGAHMTALLGVGPRYLARPERIAGFVGTEGIYDLPALARRFPDYPEWFLNTAFGADRKRWDEASPQAARIENVRPWLLVHSTGDELVDVAQSARFKEHLGRAGAKVELFSPAGLAHDEVIARLGQAGDATTDRIAKFVLGR